MSEIEYTVPMHVACIMDGNGRWAKAKHRTRMFGHKMGSLAIKNVVKAAIECGVKYLTFFAFSTENWNRPDNEVNFLMWLFERALKKYSNKLLSNNIRFVHLGDKSSLPVSLSSQLDFVENLTKNCSKFTVVLAINYGARDEMLRAAKFFAGKCLEDGSVPENLNWNMFSSFFYTKDIPDPELIIRTSGEQRLSNFLLAQSAYSELYFTPTYWPDFDEKMFKEAIKSYIARDRRFGTIKELKDVKKNV